MALKNTDSTYGTITKIFHWTTAVLIFAVVPLGLIAHSAPYTTNEELAQKAMLFSFHKTIGVAIFFVALLRIAWAATQVKPAPLHNERTSENFLAELVHWLLYGSLVLAPLSGWIHHAATSGFAPIWWPFGQNLPFVAKDESVALLFGNFHWIWTKVMVASILLHIAGAAKHQFIDKDTTFARMWFGSVVTQVLPKPVKSFRASFIAALIFAFTAALSTSLPSENPEIAATELKQAATEWDVKEGTIALQISQFGQTVTGQFEDWTSAIVFDPGTGSGTVTTQIAIASLSLGSVSDQAMGPDFFDVVNFPIATFTAEIKPNSGAYLATGTLRIKDQSIAVELPFGLEVAVNEAQMTGTITLNRMDFLIGQSMTDETNLGLDVVIDINLTASKAN